MRFGPTSLQVSSIIAKGLRRPKLRSDLRISEQSVAGEKSFVVKNAETNSYNRYGATEYELLTLCDGSRTPAEIGEELTRRHPDQPLEESEVLDFLDSIEPAMWERSLGEKNLAILERLRDERKSRIDQSSVLYISFKAWDPDKTLAKLDPWLGWIYTRGFVVFSIAIFITAICLLADDWTRVQRDTLALYSFAGKSSYDIWMFWILLFALGGIHELGHGLTCKHFGGEVHQMGFLLIYFTPAFFTDTTDILLFDKAYRRQWVIFAGMWIELVICGLAALVWHFTPPGSLVNDIAYKTTLLSGIHGAFLNLNPLIKADGYYALSQFLNIDNLREESFAYLCAWSKKYLLRRDMDLPPASRRQRRIFLTFGIVAIIYGLTLIILGGVFVKNVLVRRFGDWGYLLTAGVIYFFARKALRNALPQAHAWWRERREEYMAWKMTRTQQVGILGVAVLLLAPPIPTHVTSNFILEPGAQARLRATVPGQVSQLLARQGDIVQPGQVIAVLHNAELESEAMVIERQFAMAEYNLRAALASSDREAEAKADRQRDRLARELEVARRNAAELQVRAPIAGVVTTPEIEQKVGEFLAAGDDFAILADHSSVKARILVRDWELEDVRLGAPVKLKVQAHPFRTYTGHVAQILPAAAADRPVANPEKLERLGQELTNYFAVVLEIPNSDGSLSEGMTGTAKISGKNRPIGWQIGRGAWRWLHSQVW